MKKFLTTFLVITLSFQLSFAQETKAKKTGPRRQLATIVFAGFGGAILGLSTLSFYGRPQEQLVNIAIGFAVGVIGGTVYVTFKSATTEEYIEKKQVQNSINLSPYVPLTEDQKIAGVGAQLNFNF
ncbi:MAG: hypothetical protein IPM57_04840 [Oligoflexia bacterium]|nr:hypothetical protein [Oligoflexia bacterium]